MTPADTTAGATATGRRLLVGLTGGMASGKSTVARMLSEEGFTVVDADRIVADLYRPGEAGADALRALLGGDALTPGGAVDHQQVAARIFAAPTLRKQVEAAIHPLVRQRFATLANATEGVIVLEATLLVEAGYPPDFDLVVSVEAEADARLARAIGRGMSEAQARARLAAQGDGAVRRAGADRLLRNDGSLDALRQTVASLADELRARLAARPATG